MKEGFIVEGAVASGDPTESDFFICCIREINRNNKVCREQFVTAGEDDEIEFTEDEKQAFRFAQHSQAMECQQAVTKAVKATLEEMAQDNKFPNRMLSVSVRGFVVEKMH